MYVLEKADDQKFELNAGSRPYLIQIFDHRPSQVRKSPLCFDSQGFQGVLSSKIIFQQREQNSAFKQRYLSLSDEFKY